MIGKVIGHIEEKNTSKYLVFDSSDEKKEVLKNTRNFGMRLKKFEIINGDKTTEYCKYFMKIKF